MMLDSVTIKRFRVDVYNQFWNGTLQKRMYIEAKTEAEARSKGYDEYCKTLLFAPLAQPCFEVIECK